jgi:hypothetical protein
MTIGRRIILLTYNLKTMPETTTTPTTTTTTPRRSLMGVPQQMAQLIAQNEILRLSFEDKIQALQQDLV